MFCCMRKKKKKAEKKKTTEPRKRCEACDLEKGVHRRENKYRVTPLKRTSHDHETVCRAFMATSWHTNARWTPEILRVYSIVGNSRNEENAGVRYEGGMLLYFGMRVDHADDFLWQGFGRTNRLSYGVSWNGQVRLTNSSFAAVTACDPKYSGSGEPWHRCECVPFANEVVHVVVCEVPRPEKCKVFDLEPKIKGLHPFEKYKGRVTMEDDCHFRDSMGRGLSKGSLNFDGCSIGDPVGERICDEFLVGDKLVKPVYLVAVRFRL